MWQGFRLWLLQQEVEQGEQWNNDLAVSHTLSKHSEIQWKHSIQNIMIITTDTIHIAVADSCVLPLLFLQSVSILSCCPVVNIHSCHQDRQLLWVGRSQYHPHTGFRYCKLLTCVMIVAALAIFQAWILMGVSIGKCPTSFQIRHMIRLFEL